MRVKLRNFRIGRLMTGAAALVALVPVAHAQQGTPTPAPAPRGTPSIITLPGADRFNLPASGVQPATRPTVQPTPTPTPAPRPAQTPAARPTPTPAARATPTPRPAATPASRAAAPVAQPSVTPTAAATPLPQPVALPTAAPTPVVPVPIATPLPTPAAEGQGVPWLWILIGAAMASVLVALGWLLGRRRRAEPVEQEVEVAPPRPAPATPPLAPPPPPAPRPAPRPAPPAEPVIVELRPIAIELADTGAVLDFEIVVANATPAQIDGLRVAYGLMSASQIQDELIASFHMTQLPPVADPFNLAPRDGMRIPGKVGLAPDKINVVEVGGRPMFVPLLMVDLRWRAGLSVKHLSCDFMVGIGGQGDKLGPIWLDRGAQRHERLNANRYFPKPVAAAAE